jgi:heparanase 1
VGGSEADKIYYDLSDAPVAVAPARYSSVLTRAEWDAVHEFAGALGYRVMFVLNAGPGPRAADRHWLPDNARTLLEYTRKRGYDVALWELGNEVNAFPFIHGLSFKITGSEFAKDVAAARALLDQVLPGAMLSAPSSAYWPKAGEVLSFYDEFLAAGGGKSVDLLTWHYYPQQSRRCALATLRASADNMLDPDVLNEIDTWAAQMESARDAGAPGKPILLGETGNAQCGGEPGLSNTFVAGFWWLDELARIARRGERAVVRQTLSGSDYGLIDEFTLEPRPDYWTSVLWRRLVGRRVLDAQVDSNPLVRVYAHCARGGPPGAVVLVVVNLDRTRAVSLRLDAMTSKDSAAVYELSAPALASSEIRLNGMPLAADQDGALPALAPLVVQRKSSMLRARFGPATYGFVVVPGAAPNACP